MTIAMTKMEAIWTESVQAISEMQFNIILQWRSKQKILTKYGKIVVRYQKIRVFQF
jgi:hypothetical protein